MSGLRSLFPDLGTAGSRSALLHRPSPETVGTRTVFPARDRTRFRAAQLSGTFGAVLVAVGGLGAGAVPVVDNSLWSLPVVGFLSLLLHSTTVTVFVGTGFLVLGWLMMWRYCLPARDRDGAAAPTVPLRTLWRTVLAWSLPLLATAPLFTQDIYSYLAQGSVAARGLDPYSAGPADLLGVDDPLARSVPLVWAHSPAPYGPVAVGLASLIYRAVGDAVGPAVLLHRVIAVAGLALAAWAMVRLARRCGVRPQATLWLGALNPLVPLHLIGGLHNEALMMGLMLAGLELSLTATDRSAGHRNRYRVLVGAAGLVLICCAGMVKVTAFLALGFAGVAVARYLGGRFRDLVAVACVYLLGAVAVVAAFSYGSGLGTGWLLVQGGAADVVSWMSLTTDIGLLSSSVGSALALGDHTDTALTVMRLAGLAVGGFWVVRMLWASFRGAVHPVGGLGVATFFLVLFFPVVHPWYLLWAVMPLAAWADRAGFRVTVAVISSALSFFILPRGLNLPPSTVSLIYLMFVFFFLVLLGVGVLAYRRIRAAESGSGTAHGTVTGAVSGTVPGSGPNNDANNAAAAANDAADGADYTGAS
ncbi:polyprenol phosphomannose-dependent alpha 1,6 mannosyltransferase MptB [Corynebacterium neomassiliense]|uniref:polyprenol phosphomannose-dependent alpha 1,6 mannosyltransferase MptB n=1 Tax=Corynebacterium neomassiliense TaxID=2079482 RepID=UPI00192A4A02|nr:polyprenol phosphomannose-dependent alpha 1,6 mannosyltransferase MptB [Corynebacterium neomassiliense]